MFEKYQITRFLKRLLRDDAQAEALVKGVEPYTKIRGNVYFYQTPEGVVVAANITGLPYGDSDCNSHILGFHIHAGKSCSGTSASPLANTGQHYSKSDCAHPHHSGDMPPLFVNNGRAFMLFLTDRFSIKDIIGRTVVIHDMPDDFTTQPAGNSGNKIACGEIKRT